MQMLLSLLIGASLVTGTGYAILDSKTQANSNVELQASSTSKEVSDEVHNIQEGLRASTTVSNGLRLGSFVKNLLNVEVNNENKVDLTSQQDSKGFKGSAEVNSKSFLNVRSE